MSNNFGLLYVSKTDGKTYLYKSYKSLEELEAKLLADKEFESIEKTSAFVVELDNDNNKQIDNKSTSD